MKIYISGKISGIEEEAFRLFDSKEKVLMDQGHDVVNPMKLRHDHDKSWKSYMIEDIKALVDCDAIYMLKNWTESQGAVIEHGLAESLGINIVYES